MTPKVLEPSTVPGLSRLTRLNRFDASARVNHSPTLAVRFGCPTDSVTPGIRLGRSLPEMVVQIVIAPACDGKRNAVVHFMVGETPHIQHAAQYPALTIV